MNHQWIKTYILLLWICFSSHCLLHLWTTWSEVILCNFQDEYYKFWFLVCDMGWWWADIIFSKPSANHFLKNWNFWKNLVVVIFNKLFNNLSYDSKSGFNFAFWIVLLNFEFELYDMTNYFETNRPKQVD